MHKSSSNVVRMVNTLRAAAIAAFGLLPAACSSGSNPGASLVAKVGSALSTCTPSMPCSIWSTSAMPLGSDTSTSVELGVKVQSTEAGYVTGVRFYKDDANATHTVNLWDGLGNLLASASSTSETSGGWQTVTFAQAAPVAANTTYVASYFMPAGDFALDRPGFTDAVVNAPLEALADGQDGGNGVYAYGASSSFPGDSVYASNYWVDILFSTTAPPPTCTPSAPCSIWSTSATPAGSDMTTSVELGVKVQSTEAGYVTGVRFYKDDASATHTVNLWDGLGNLLASGTSTSETSGGWQTVTFARAAAVAASTTYVASYFMPGGNFPLDRPGFTNAVVNAPLEALADGQDGGNGVYAYGASSSFPSTSVDASNYWVDILFSTTAPPPTCTPSAPCSIWSTSATPAGSDMTTSVELGVKVQSTEAGYVTGVRFYKDDANATHTVNLWDGLGNLLASGTSTSETSSGWQTVTFARAAAVAASTTYVASYFMPGGNFPLDRPGFTNAVVNAPLEALADGQDGGNGVYAYGASSSFPSTSVDASNYWVDILFSTTAPPPTCTPSAPCSIWSTSATPAGSDMTTSVELGVKVQSTEAGYVTGVRFYKDDANATHTVNLWDGLGNLLASGTSTSETSGGWQTVTFGQAAAVAASTTYVASYFMPGGNFPLDRPGFTDAVVNAPLEALADGQDGGNGVYAYGASSSFPSTSVDASNYWVDILFSTTSDSDGGTGTGDGGTADGGADAGVDDAGLLAFPGQVAAAICARFEACCPPTGNGLRFDTNACISQYLNYGYAGSSTGQPVLDGGNVTFDPAQAQSCLNQIAAIDCTTNLRSSAQEQAIITACFGALTGVQQVGAPCQASIECAPGEFCAPTGSCAALRGDGGSCGDFGASQGVVTLAQVACSYRSSGNTGLQCHNEDYVSGALFPDAGSWFCNPEVPLDTSCNFNIDCQSKLCDPGANFNVYLCTNSETFIYPASCNGFITDAGSD